ncbi:hypothetical protein FRC09_013386 [Ceratobasidium sp. 395]|nr:hypothetical protein FRC09_013386 [Ceratobasidium sp. 395]
MSGERKQQPHANEENARRLCLWHSVSQAQIPQPVNTSEDSSISTPRLNNSLNVSAVNDCLLESTQSTNHNALDTTNTAARCPAISSWPGLKSLQDALGSFIGPLEPLKSAVSELAWCLQNESTAGREYSHLTCVLDELLQDISTHFKDKTPRAIAPVIETLAFDIRKEAEKISQKRQSSKISRLLEASKGLDEVEACYRRIQAMLERLKKARLSRLPISSSAKYDSAASVTLRRTSCVEDTRVDILQKLWDWVNDPASEKVYWLNGMAGTGKTTIAYSLCERLREEQMLAASFFCSQRLPECRDANRIVPTISYQLSLFSHPFKYALSQVLDQDPEAHNQSILQQFKQLVVRPWMGSLSSASVQNAMPTNLVVVIDALDECEGKEIVVQTVQALLLNATDLPIKFFVASRPAARILDHMRERIGDRLCFELRLHELDHSTVQADIRTYLKTKLTSPRLKLTEANLETLVKRSGVLFIYAATIANYIASDNFSRARKRLQDVLSILDGVGHDSSKNLDALYTVILTMAFDDLSMIEEERKEMRLVLYTVICAREPLSVSAMAWLLGLDGEDCVDAALRPLFSVIHVPDTTRVITTLHKSFSEYLLDERRSGLFYCDWPGHNAFLARSCFARIKTSESPFDICHLESYIQDKYASYTLDARTKNAISAGLLYACRYWSAHLTDAVWSEALTDILWGFLSEKLLLWLEVMSLIGGRNYTKNAELSLSETLQWLMTVKDIKKLDEKFELLQDAYELTTSVANCRMYVSALLRWPKNKALSKHYRQKIPWMMAEMSVAMTRYEPETSPSSQWSRVGSRTAAISSLSYSTDSAYIASGQFDNTIRILHAPTGLQVGEPLAGHTSWTNSVSFSPSGAHIASGSSDGTVRIWETKTGQMVGEPLIGHDSVVFCVSYSPDGRCIASGSADGTLCVWDSSSGRLVIPPICAHPNTVLSVAYFQDSTRIASASGDCTISIWDTNTGQRVGEPFEGHTKPVKSVACSPDGTFIVSGSRDNTLRIWDVHTGRLAGQPLCGHSRAVCCVDFSIDGKLVASGSDDGTIRIWAADSGQPIASLLLDDPSPVNSVKFSPDGSKITSGSIRSIDSWDLEAALQPESCMPGPDDNTSDLGIRQNALILRGQGHSSLPSVFSSSYGLITILENFQRSGFAESLLYVGTCSSHVD